LKKVNHRRIPKQARGLQRYERILDAAANLFSENGFEVTTTNEIAARAGTSIGSVYQYFGNKEAIVAALSTRYVSALRDVTETVLGAGVNDLGTAAAADRLLDPIIAFHAQHPEFRLLWLGTELSDTLKSAMKDMDDEVVGRVERLLEARAPRISHERAHVVVTAMHLALKALLALIGRPENAGFKDRVAAEVKHMLTAYIDEVIREQEG